MQTIDITPTPEGMAHSIKLFDEQIAKSEHLIKVAEEWLELMDIERCVYVVPSEFPIFEAALEALQEQERQRIEHMREAIAAAGGEYPTCGAPLGIHECVRPQGHAGPHACDSECDLGHLREDELPDESGR
ncbi:MAG TPA: hypothetical protein VNN21_03045 [Dehalococcoidia bacterium]|nr:hypothetical protein [Dehalococcoidia bacterium]